MSGWRRLKYFCTELAQYGLNVPAHNYKETGTRLIRTSDINDRGALIDAGEVYIDDSVIEPNYRLIEGDLLLSRSGTLGRCLRYQSAIGPATFAGYLIRFRPSPDSEPRYLEYCTQALSFQQAIEAEAPASTISNFNAERYANLSIRWWPLDRQRAIADYLDTETSRIDTLITKKRRMIELLDEYDQSLVDDHFERATTDGLARLGYLAEVRSGMTLSGTRPTTRDDVTVPYLRVANVQHDRLDLTEVKTVTVDRATAQRTALRSGDVLMTEGGDIDKLGRGTVWRAEIDPCLHQNHVFAVRVRTRDLLPDFLALVTRTSHARRYFEMTGVRSTNLASTNSSKVASFRIPLPDLGAQIELVRSYRNRRRVLRQARKSMDHQVELLHERRQALITATVTGGLRAAG